jgi:hypothetical protein
VLTWALHLARAISYLHQSDPMVLHRYEQTLSLSLTLAHAHAFQARAQTHTRTHHAPWHIRHGGLLRRLLLRRLITAAHYGGLLRRLIATAYCDGLLRRLITAAYYNGLLRRLITAAYYDGLLRRLITAAYYGGLLRRLITTAYYDGLLRRLIMTAMTARDRYDYCSDLRPGVLYLNENHVLKVRDNSCHYYNVPKLEKTSTFSSSSN